MKKCMMTISLSDRLITTISNLTQMMRPMSHIIPLVIKIILMTMTMMILKMLITNPDGKSELSQPGHAGGEADQVEAALLSHRDLAVLQRV